MKPKTKEQIARDDQFRKALEYLKRVYRPTIKQLARYAGCSTRHIQAVLSDKERRAVGGRTGQMISFCFGLSYMEMLNLGQHLIDGHDPELFYLKDKIKIDQKIFNTEDTYEHEMSKLQDFIEDIDTRPNNIVTAIDNAQAAGGDLHDHAGTDPHAVVLTDSEKFFINKLREKDSDGSILDGLIREIKKLSYPGLKLLL